MLARMLVTVSSNASGKVVKRVTNFYRDEALQRNVVSIHPGSTD
jgi:site-specific DNA recombinase